MKRHFFVRDQYLGSADIMPLTAVKGELQPPWARAWFCPLCGEVWARAAIEGQPYGVYSLSCDKHPSQWEHSVNGSIWIDHDRDYIESLPPYALRRELLLHLTHAARFQ